MQDDDPLSEAGLAIVKTSTPADSSITDALTLLSSEISESIGKLAETLSSTLDSAGGLTPQQASFAIFVVVIGAFSAYLFNLLHWKTVRKHQKLSGTCLALNALINDLESISINYWLRDYKPDEEVEIREAEISIKTNIRLISTYTKLLTTQLGSRIPESRKQLLESFPVEIFDLATGDGFESVSKKSSRQKAQKISKSCSGVKAQILTINTMF